MTRSLGNALAVAMVALAVCLVQIQQTQADTSAIVSQPPPLGSLAKATLRPIAAGVQPLRPVTQSPALQTPATATPSKLTLLPSSGLKLMPGGYGVYDIGDVSAISTPHVDREYTLRNDSSSPITIVRIQPSCGCTTAFIESSGKHPVTSSASRLWDMPATTLVPGQTVKVLVSVNLLTLSPGPLQKSVAVYTQGASAASAVLELTGTYSPSITVTPSVIDFGSVQAGSPHTAELTVTLDPRLAKDDQSPILVSSNPEIELKLAPVVVDQTGTKTPTASANERVVKTYSVVLTSSAPLGQIHAVLSFAPISLPGSSDASQTLNTGSVLVLGEVDGDVAALPGALAFGTVQEGVGTARQLVLTGKNISSLQGISVACASSFISTALTDQPNTVAVMSNGQPSVPAKVVTVTLNKDTPQGILQTEIKVTLASGLHLVIPVSANVETISAS